MTALNLATAIMLGSETVARVYLGAEQIWPAPAQGPIYYNSFDTDDRSAITNVSPPPSLVHLPDFSHPDDPIDGALEFGTPSAGFETLYFRVPVPADTDLKATVLTDYQRNNSTKNVSRMAFRLQRADRSTISSYVEITLGSDADAISRTFAGHPDAAFIEMEFRIRGNNAATNPSVLRICSIKIERSE